MHKKIEAELVSLAHSILQMKSREDVNELHKKTLEIYEKLSVLKFVDAYMNSSLDTTMSEVEIEKEVENIVVNDEVLEQEPSIKIETEEEIIIEDKVEITEDKTPNIEENIEEAADVVSKIEDFIEKEETLIKNDVEDLPSLQVSLEEEFKDAISADVATELFEKATIENPVIEEPKEIKKSLNDTLFKHNLQIGLNDRIAFVKHLFDGSQEDFNRVVSQLNSFKVEEDAKKFITNFVKPDYSWEGKEEYEEKLNAIIERKFM